MRDRTEAYVWWCGDEVCDCTQPIIERITPNMAAVVGAVRRERIWTGTFHSGADAEQRAQQWEQLRQACAARGLPPPEEAGS